MILELFNRLEIGPVALNVIFQSLLHWNWRQDSCCLFFIIGLNSLVEVGELPKPDMTRKSLALRYLTIFKFNLVLERMSHCQPVDARECLSFLPDYLDSKSVNFDHTLLIPPLSASVKAEIFFWQRRPDNLVTSSFSTADSSHQSTEICRSNNLTTWRLHLCETVRSSHQSLEISSRLMQ